MCTSAGSSTACIVVLDRQSHQLHTANLGDSGFLVVRGGEVVHRSDEQQHYFNTPFQLSIAPPGAEGAVLSDRWDAHLLPPHTCELVSTIGSVCCAVNGAVDKEIMRVFCTPELIIQITCKHNKGFNRLHCRTFCLVRVPHTQPYLVNVVSVWCWAAV